MYINLILLLLEIIGFMFLGNTFSVGKMLWKQKDCIRSLYQVNEKKDQKKKKKENHILELSRDGN